MRRLWTLVITLALGTGLAFAQARPTRNRGGEDQNREKKGRNRQPNNRVIHVRMQAVILSDNDGSNPAGILTVAQLKQWIHKANETYRASDANLMLDFDADKDIADRKDSCLNRLNHNQNEHASAVAAEYPGKMVVFFRAYSQKEGSLCAGNSGPTGNGYTMYNPYVPLGSKGCPRKGSPKCSASYVVMPSVYCFTTVGTDKVHPLHPNPPFPSDDSGCHVASTSLYTYQNFNELVHEVGHYFGLPHTFPGSSDFLLKPGDLQNWYDGNPRAGTTRSIKVFDGDSPDGPQAGGYAGWTYSVTDTPPDAGAQIFASNGVNMCDTPTGFTIHDGSGAKVTFNGASYTLEGKDEHKKPLSLTFTPDKGDVMSYFFCKNPMTFSASQVNTMRHNLLTDPQRTYLLCADSNNAELKQRPACKDGDRQ
jgi:hypothetical protein